MIFAKIIGKYLLYLTALLFIPLLLAVYEGDPVPFLISFLFCALLALLCRYWGRNATDLISQRDCILVVVLLWIITSLLSALPFCLSRTLNPLDAYFEAMSGITTTGATVMAARQYDPLTGAEVPIHLTNPHVPGKTYTYFGTISPLRDPNTNLILKTGIEAVSRPLLLWRSMLQWVGGIGIIVIFLAVLPALSDGGRALYQMEVSAPVKEGISPRVHSVALRVVKLYGFLTLFCLFALLFTNMPSFDAICTSLTTVSTGGFSVRNDSIASYQSIAIDVIIMVFMVLGSINFNLYFHLFKRTFFRPDLLLFLTFAGLGCLAVSLFLIPTLGLRDAFLQGSFQALSFQTTTGFFSTNYDFWPFAPQMWLLLLMFIGGMTGSTAGGIKASRFYIAYKILLNRLELLFRPDSVRKLYIGKTEVDDQNALTVLSFFCIVAFFTILSTVIFILDGIDPETSLGLSASFLNNVGISFRAAGPTTSVAFLPPLSKILATIWMLLGRLEYFIILLLFLPSYWKSR